MASVQYFLKDPDDVLDYTIDYADWLETSDEVSTSSWSLDTGITEDSSSNSTTSATIWLSGGTAGVDYDCTNSIVTDDGREKDTTITIRVMER